MVFGILQETQKGLAEKKPWDISSLLLDVHRIANEAAASIYVNDSFQYAILTRTSEGVGAHALFPPKVQVGSIELLDASERVHVFLGNQLVVPWHIEPLAEVRWLSEFHHVLTEQLWHVLNCRQLMEQPQNSLFFFTAEQLSDSYGAAMKRLSPSVDAFCSGDLSQVHGAVKAYHDRFA